MSVLKRCDCGFKPDITYWNAGRRTCWGVRCKCGRVVGGFNSAQEAYGAWNASFESTKEGGSEKGNDKEYVVYHYTGGETHGQPYVTKDLDDAFSHARTWCQMRMEGDPHKCCVVEGALEDDGEVVGVIANWDERTGKPIPLKVWDEACKRINEG